MNTTTNTKQRFMETHEAGRFALRVPVCTECGRMKLARGWLIPPSDWRPEPEPESDRVFYVNLLCPSCRLGADPRDGQIEVVVIHNDGGSHREHRPLKPVYNFEVPSIEFQPVTEFPEDVRAIESGETMIFEVPAAFRWYNSLRPSNLQPQIKT